jgi:GntR family transcriptional regulator
MEAEDMHIILNNSSMVPIYEQLMDQVKNAIINGELSENEALPSVRALSGKLRISALTVKKAYDRLEEEGFVVTVHGKGTYVAAADRQLALEARRKSVEDDFAAAVSKAAAVGLGREDILEIVEIILEDYPWS